MTDAQPIAAAEPEGRPDALYGKTARAVWLALGLSLLVPLVPGLEGERWVPDEWTELLPRVFRQTPETVPEPALAGLVDDSALMAMGDEEESRSVISTEQARQGFELGRVEEEEEEEPVEDGMVVASDAHLPTAPRVGRTPGGLPLLPIEDPQRGLRRFYYSVQRVAEGREGAVTRVLHYGDSLITGDYVTQTVRRLLQKKFGDAGHGFVLAGRPSPWYRRNHLLLSSSKGWEVHRLTRPTIADGAYGLGGATFRTHKPGQWLRLEPRGETLGAEVSRFQVFYLAQPRGGRFEIDVGGRSVVVNTRDDEPGSRTAEVMLQPGHHALKVRTLGGGEVRLFGVVLERDGPGLVYDSLGIDGARAKLLKRMDPGHWHEQIRLRRPDLLVLHYGTNESQWKNLSASRYRADLAQTVGHLRQALPGVSCLLVGPMDRAERDDRGRLSTRPVVKRIVRVQREVAYAQGCAFWDAYRAMGGEGSMARWRKAKPPLAGADLTHPTRLGADRLGAMLYAALMDGYARRKENGY